MDILNKNKCRQISQLKERVTKHPQLPKMMELIIQSTSFSFQAECFKNILEREEN